MQLVLGYTPVCSPRVEGARSEGEVVSGRASGRVSGWVGGRAGEQSAVPAACSRIWPDPRAARAAPVAVNAPGKDGSVLCGAWSRSRRPASAAFGQLVGVQCMQTGSLVRNTRVWQRQRMLGGTSGTERRLQRSRRGLARTTSFFHRSTGAHITLLHTVSRLTCSHVILNGTLIKVRWQYCAESGYRTLTSRDVNEFRNTRTDLCFMHMQKGRCLEEFGYLAYHVWWPQLRYITSSDHVARGRGAFDRDAVQVGVFVGL